MARSGCFCVQVFRELEHPAEMSKFNGLIRNLESQRFRLIRFSHLCSQDTLKCNQLLDEYELAVIVIVVFEACQGGVQLPLKSKDEVASRWSFPESAFFASTVLTTIGYGNTVPNTFWGRLFCILFALVGIPLTLSVIADMGVLMATALSGLHQKAKPFIPTKNFISGLSSTRRRWLSALGGIVFLVLYLSAGAAIFMVWEEDWGFFEGFYFCFITMTTIGFGDLVPKNPNYMFMCTLYILVGLALTSTIIELVRRQYARSWKTIQALSGPLGDMLKRMGEGAGTGLDMATFQTDLKKILTVMNVPRKTNNGKEWQEAIDSVLHDIGYKSKDKKTPQVLQIVVYETTV
ncbi:hypothetical protein RUM44_006551 [Polyplax serrata]|uniref:Potassium channel domain-containing protein n=1 Tax=Polyplax serrata TaxID=468196 RepID=A0ABR1AK60_POLSC